MSVTNENVRTERPDGCPAVDDVVALLGDRWSLLVFGALRRGSRLRYGQIQDAVAGISQRMLTVTLKKLEANGFVTRTLFPTVPPRVDYALSPLGESLVAPVRALLDWTMANRAALADARAAYARARS